MKFKISIRQKIPQFSQGIKQTYNHDKPSAFQKIPVPQYPIYISQTTTKTRQKCQK